jgi:hypothetical protein
MFAALIAACTLGAPPELNDETLQPLCKAICPSQGEQDFLEIGWHASFFSAVNEAVETNKPILLWAMNGHPLGCT